VCPDGNGCILDDHYIFKICIENESNKEIKMKKENIEIEIPKGYVSELKDGKVTLIYKGDPLDEIPKSWKELGRIGGEYINGDAEINGMEDGCDTVGHNKNIIPKGLGNPMLALIQLLQLRNRTWEVTDSKPKGDMFPVVYDPIEGCLSVKDSTHSFNHPIKFSKKEVSVRFLEYHKELL